MRSEAGHQLVARILWFWMDGYIGYSARIEVEYTLADSNGATVWSQRVKGQLGRTVLTTSAWSRLLSDTLAYLAREAAKQFQDEAFQTALR